MMKQTKSLQSLRHFWLMGAFLSLLFPAVASAQSSKSVGNPAIIAQLEIVKTTLAVLGDKLVALDSKLVALDSKLDAQQDDINIKLDALDDTLDMHGDDLAFLVADAESPEDITLSTTLCFGMSISNELAVGGNVEAGAGWPNVAHVELKAMVDAKLFGLESGIAEEICIEVPLYKVASEPLPFPAFLDTKDFDDLIKAIALPSQAVIPLVASLYTAVMPSKDEVMAATENVIVAATGINIRTGAIGAPNPQMLLRPDLLFEPIIAPYQGFINGIPTAVATMAADPCGVLENSVLRIDTSSLTVVCDIGPDFVHFVINIVDPLHLIHFF